MSKVVCDKDKCCGCLACIVACMDQHYDETVVDAVSPRIHEKYTSERTGLVKYVTKCCVHCEDAPCVNACPHNVLVKNENGFVVIVDIAKCDGCKKCLEVCQYDAVRFDKNGKIVKCDGCAERVKHGLVPTCVKACPTGALTVED